MWCCAWCFESVAGSCALLRKVVAGDSPHKKELLLGGSQKVHGDWMKG